MGLDPRLTQWEAKVSKRYSMVSVLTILPNSMECLAYPTSSWRVSPLSGRTTENRDLSSPWGGSLHSRQSSALRKPAVFQRNDRGEQEIVLLVDVQMSVGLEFCEAFV